MFYIVRFLLLTKNFELTHICNVLRLELSTSCYLEMRYPLGFNIAWDHVEFTGLSMIYSLGEIEGGLIFGVQYNFYLIMDVHSVYNFFMNFL